MSSKIYYINQIASKRKQLISLRADVKEVRERKKIDVQRINKSIKSTSVKSLKESYRKRRETIKQNADNKIERLKDKIERCKADIKRYTEAKKKAK